MGKTTMKAGRASKTALAAAAIRANHYLNAINPVFSDPFALDMTSTEWRKLLSNQTFTRLFNSAPVNRTFGKLTGQVVARSRYSEDLLKQAIENGIEQYILVGAGLDSFILRLANLYPNLRIFEVDHPDTQKLKLHKLQKYGNVPKNVEFVCIDFEKESLSDALSRSAYNKNKAGFYSWLGTTHYLQPETTLTTLKNIADFVVDGSEVVLDYSVDYRNLIGIERIGSMLLSRFTQLLKEPLIGAFLPEHLHQSLENMGYEVVEDLTGLEISQRYFEKRPDYIRHTHATHMLHLRKNKY